MSEGGFNSLITGGAGLIGSHVADACVRAGHKVVVLDDLTGGRAENVPEQAQFVQGSVLDHELVELLFASFRFDFVFHLAAYAAEYLSHFTRRHNYLNNIVGTANLVNAAVRTETVKRFVFASSTAVYGDAEPPLTEKTTPQPIDPYGIAKYASEADLSCAFRIFGMQFTIFRPHNVYGERQNILDPFRNVLGIFMHQVMNGRPMTIFGNGLQTRPFTHVSDVSRIIAECIDYPESANRVFNIGCSQTHRVIDVAHAVAGAFGEPPAIEFLASRQEVTHMAPSHGELERVFGGRAWIPLDAGIGRMAQWARTTRGLDRGRLPVIEVQRSLPTRWAQASA